jgi:hypothetical protein
VKGGLVGGGAIRQPDPGLLVPLPRRGVAPTPDRGIAWLDRLARQPLSMVYMLRTAKDLHLFPVISEWIKLDDAVAFTGRAAVTWI